MDGKVVRTTASLRRHFQPRQMHLEELIL